MSQDSMLTNLRGAVSKELSMAGNYMKVGAVVTLLFLSPAFSQPDSTLGMILQKR